MTRFLVIFNTTDNPGGLNNRIIIDAANTEEAQRQLEQMYDLLSNYTIRPLEPADYLAIRFWGKMLGSYEYYIVHEQEKAFSTKAPLDATYLKHRETINDPIIWVTISGTENPEIAPAYSNFLKEYNYAS